MPNADHREWKQVWRDNPRRHYIPPAFCCPVLRYPWRPRLCSHETLAQKVGTVAWLVFGLLLLIIFGSVIIDGSNKDFRLFAQPLVNVALFAVLFPLFGLLIAPMVRWLDQTLPPTPPGLPLHFRMVAVYLLLGAVSLIALYSIVLTGLNFLLGGEGEGQYIWALFYYMLLVVPGAYLITKQLRRTPKQSWDAQVSPNLGVIGYSVLAVPTITGLVVTIRSVSQIL
jgi:hypothetical protein